MFDKAKKWLVCLPLLVAVFMLAFCCVPPCVWAAEDDEGASQIYAIYAAGGNQQGGGSNQNNDTQTGAGAYESVPGYVQDEPTDNNGNDSNNNQNNSENGNNDQNNDLNGENSANDKQNNEENANNSENNEQNSNSNENTGLTADEPANETGADFPALADSVQVQIWDEASQANQKKQVTPVNLALRGSYLPSDVPAMAVSGRTLVPVRLISEQLEAAVVWEKTANTVTISLDGKTIVLTIGSSQALVDGQPVQVPGDVSVSLVTYAGTARTMVPVRFVSESLNATVDYDAARHIVNITPPPEPEPEPEPDNDEDIWYNRPITPDGNYVTEPEPEPEPIPPPGIDENGNLLRRVVVDAGHGGTDPGTNGRGLEEKNINLAVALKLQKELQNAGFEVIMARSDDSYVGLVERAALTVQADAPVFVSIHCNSAANIPTANGIETYAAPGDADDAELAGFIQKELIAVTKAKDRGVKTSSLVVLTHNAAPACLVEIGFMSNSAECAKIADAAYQQKLAEAVSAGVQAYFAAKAEQ